MAKNPREFNTDEISLVLQRAFDDAKTRNHEYVSIEHLVYVMLDDTEVAKTLATLSVDVDAVRTLINEAFDTGVIPMASPGEEPVDTETLRNLIKVSVAQVMFSARQKAVPVDLLLGVLQLDNSLGAQALRLQGLTELKLKSHLAHGGASVTGTGNAPGLPMTTGPDGEQRVKDVTNKEEAILFLEKFTTNLNKVAEEGLIDSVIGRETELDEIIQITARRSKNNVVMVGEPGVGKTAIAEGLALKIVRKEVPELIQNSTVYSLSIGDLIAGTRFRGDFEERMKFVLKSLTFVDEPILFIDEIHMIMGAGAGKEGAMDVANLLKPALAKGKLRCIGSTTFDEYQKHFEKDRALIRRFERLDINEPDIESAKLIMRGLRQHYEKHHGVTYTDEALDAAVVLTSRFVQNKFLPDKAIDVIDRSGARQRVKPAETKLAVIDVAQIEFEVSKVARIPEKNVNSSERDRLQNLDGTLKKRVFGQPTAISTLVDAVMMARSGLREDNKTAGAFLFVGPSGVGKTEAARALAEAMDLPLVKFDMSEYAEQHTVAKLIGAPPGYVGHGEAGAGTGLLTTAIENKPACVLLLDEIEKAHPMVLNTFLQVMDDGKLANSNGKTVHFNNVYVLFTSNLGVREQSAGVLGFTMQTRAGAEDKAINSFLSPEFRNRLDATVKFVKLGKELRLNVVDKFVGRLEARVKDRDLSLVVTAAAREWLADQDVDENLGARPVERVVTENLGKPLSRVLVLGEPTKGATLTADLIDGVINIAVA